MTTRIDYPFAPEVVSIGRAPRHPLINTALYSAGATGWFLILRGLTRRLRGN